MSCLIDLQSCVRIVHTQSSWVGIIVFVGNRMSKAQAASQQTRSHQPKIPKAQPALLSPCTNAVVVASNDHRVSKYKPRCRKACPHESKPQRTRPPSQPDSDMAGLAAPGHRHFSAGSSERRVLVPEWCAPALLDSPAYSGVEADFRMNPSLVAALDGFAASSFLSLHSLGQWC